MKNNNNNTTNNIKESRFQKSIKYQTKLIHLNDCQAIFEASASFKINMGLFRYGNLDMDKVSL